jgi:hypothetical protein
MAYEEAEKSAATRRAYASDWQDFAASVRRDSGIKLSTVITWG